MCTWHTKTIRGARSQDFLIPHSDCPATLKRLRAEHGLSQARLAAASGIGSSQINKFEAGDGQPVLSTLTALAEALDVTVSELIGETGQPRPTFNGERTLAWQHAGTVYHQPLHLDRQGDRIGLTGPGPALNHGSLTLWERGTLTGWYLAYHGRARARGALHLQVRGGGAIAGQWVGPGPTGETTNGTLAIASTEDEARLLT